MDNGKLCALVVMLCIIAPLMVGYAWPTDAEDRIITDPINTQNVTNDKASNVPVYSNFDDLYLNNSNVFCLYTAVNNSIVGYLNTPFSGATTFNNTGFPYIAGSSSYYQASAAMNSSGTRIIDLDFDNFIEINDPNAGAYPIMMVTLSISGNTNGRLLLDGTEAVSITYYPNSKIIQYVVADNYVLGEMKTIQHKSNMLFQAKGDPHEYYAWNATYWYQGLSGGVPVYTDIDKGLNMPWVASNGRMYNATWYNGYTNQSIDILFGGGYGTQQSYFEFNNGIKLSFIWGTPMQVTLSLNGVNLETKTVGNYYYEMYWLHMDARFGEITISGLDGMTGYLGNYLQAKRVSTTFYQDFDPFQSIHVSQGTQTSAIKWLIRNTASDLYYQSGITGTYDFKRYSYDNDNGQFQLRYVTYWPISNNAIRLYYNGSYHNASIDKDGFFKFGDIKQRVEGLTISIVDKRLYINGISANVGPYTDYKIDLNGSFVTDVYFSDLDLSSERTIFTWMPGGFGLDWNGYCIAGMITSGFSGVAASLYGRRSGGKMLLVGIVATVCAAAYLVLLMGNL